MYGRKQHTHTHTQIYRHTYTHTHTHTHTQKHKHTHTHTHTYAHTHTCTHMHTHTHTHTQTERNLFTSRQSITKCHTSIAAEQIYQLVSHIFKIVRDYLSSLHYTCLLFQLMSFTTMVCLCLRILYLTQMRNTNRRNQGNATALKVMQDILVFSSLLTQVNDARY